jgi:cell division septum initiation protein DivIVA
MRKVESELQLVPENQRRLDTVENLKQQINELVKAEDSLLEATKWPSLGTSEDGRLILI